VRTYEVVFIAAPTLTNEELEAFITQMQAVVQDRNGKVIKVENWGKKAMAYEASEYLGEHLDDRFSAKSMSRFLVCHLDRKSVEARKLAKSKKDVERMTAALYNGGSHNVKRMLVGLIRSLPETERYMKKVPATRRRLDGVIAGMPMGETPVRTLR